MSSSKRGSTMKLAGILEWDEFLRLPQPEYLWGQFVRLRAVNIFQGWPQSAKSFTALHLALAVAAGDTEFLGLPVAEQLEVLYMSVEDVEADAARARMSGYAKRDVGGFRVYASSLSLTNEAVNTNAFFELLDQVSPGGLIVVDSFSAASGVDNENDSADVQAVYNLFYEAARRGYTVIVITHIAKAADPFNVTASRGSSAAAGAASSIVGFKSVEGTTTEFEIQQAKNRTGPSREQFRFDTKSGIPMRGLKIAPPIKKFAEEFKKR